MASGGVTEVTGHEPKTEYAVFGDCVRWGGKRCVPKVPLSENRGMESLTRKRRRDDDTGSRHRTEGRERVEGVKGPLEYPEDGNLL